jgi:ribosome-binding factor A
MLARKMQWLKNNQLVDPVSKVTKEMKLDEKRQHRKAADEALLGETLFPRADPKEMDPVMQSRIKKLEFSMARDTAISRARAEIRKEKLEKAAVMKAPTPDIGPVVTDPLKRHLNRRRVRVAILLQQYLEELLTCNSAQIILDHLGGASISVERVVAPSTRGVHDVYVRVTSDHKKAWVQEKLDVLTPKLRSQLAVRVNYGYTPELKFHVLDELDKFNKGRLLTLAEEAKQDVDKRLHRHFIKEMNWK